MAERAFAGGRVALELDSAMGFVESVEAGVIEATVAKSQRVDQFEAKHLSTIEYKEFSFELGLSPQCAGMYEWIKATLDLGHTRKDGAFVYGDFDFNAMSRVDFFDALLTSVQFPEVSGASKDPAKIKVKGQPSYYRNAPGDGSKLPIGGDTSTKNWVASNYRLEIGDLPCKHVQKVGALEWKQSFKRNEIGELRDYEVIPTKCEVPDLNLTISGQDFDAWSEWHKSFVIDGKCTDTDEVEGSLTYLSKDLETELGRIDFFNVGIYSLKRAAAKSNDDALSTFEVKLYCERMAFEIMV